MSNNNFNGKTGSLLAVETAAAVVAKWPNSQSCWAPSTLQLPLPAKPEAWGQHQPCDVIWHDLTIFSPRKMGLNPIVMCFLWCLILICWLNPQFWRWNNMHWICPNMEGTRFRSCCFNTGKSQSLGWPYSRKHPSEYYTVLTLKFAETLKCTCLSSPKRHHSRSTKFTVDVINNQVKFDGTINN